MAQNKRYIVRKYVMANSAMEAIRNEKKFRVDEVWIDEDWKKNQEFNPPPTTLGFKARKNT
jgi:hypothetical protein